MEGGVEAAIEDKIPVGLHVEKVGGRAEGKQGSFFASNNGQATGGQDLV